MTPLQPSSSSSASDNETRQDDQMAASSSSSSYQPPSIYQSIMSRSTPLSSAHYTAQAALHNSVQLYGSNEVTNTPAGPLISDEVENSSATDGTRSSSRTPTTYSNMTLGALTMRALPYPQPWSRSNANPMELPPNFDWLSESCGSKAAIGVIGGGVMGLLMGVFMGALTDMTPPVTMIEGKEVPQAPLKEQMRTTLRATADKSLYWCRNFAFITGVFGGSECLVEKYRGKHDVWNAVVSGCVTGAAMQAKQGPQASAIGCGGFAAFSLVIDSIMGTHS
jgi:import inner membrane translocase subunit TIM22